MHAHVGIKGRATSGGYTGRNLDMYPTWKVYYTDDITCAHMALLYTYYVILHANAVVGLGEFRSRES